MPPRPRAHWTAKLARILAEVASNGTYEANWKDSLLGGRLTGKFAVEAVYVFGSFARGADMCGDLDLLLELRRIEGMLPPSALVKRVALGRPTHVDVLIDSFGTDHYRCQFSEARLVWSRAQPDWEANIAALPALSTAARFARKTDGLPFPLRCLAISRDTAEAMVDRIADGELKSTFVPFDSVRVESGSWDEHQTHLAMCAEMGTGAATKKIVNWVMQHTFDITSEPYSFRREDHAGRLHVNEVVIRMGRPNPSATVLDHVDASRLLLVPHLSTGVPGGIWCIERGPEHSVVKAFENVELWVLGSGGVPDLVGVDETGYAGTYWQLKWSLDTYSRRSGAARAIREWAEDSEILRLRGSALLDAIARCDQVFVDDEPISTEQTAEAFLSAVRTLNARGPRRAAREGGSTKD